MNVKIFFVLSTIIPITMTSITLIFSKNERLVSNRLLSGIFFIIILLTISSLLLGNYKFREYFIIAHFLIRFMILIGPLFYLYVKSCLEKDFKFKKRNLILFIPFLISFAILLHKTVFMNY